MQKKPLGAETGTQDLPVTSCVLSMTNFSGVIQTYLHSWVILVQSGANMGIAPPSREEKFRGKAAIQGQTPRCMVRNQEAPRAFYLSWSF